MIMTASSKSRAFSLVEVMLAILILALGLLGLGAVIPVIVKQQRTASDTTQGVTVAKSAEAALLRRPEFNPWSLSTTPPNAWEHLLRDDSSWSSHWDGTGNGEDDHLWHPWTTPRNFIQPADGDMFFNSPNASRSQKVALLMRDRLWPHESMQSVQVEPTGEDRYRPQFVWDIVARRVKTGTDFQNDDVEAGVIINGIPEAVQVALFVRRIDLNIRVPRVTTGTQPTLRDVLLGLNLPNPTNDRCVPVAVVSPTDPTPTNRGTAGTGTLTYAYFLKLNARFSAARRDRIELFQGALSTTGNAELLLTLASQPNQKLVDNFGNVYTVLRVDDQLSTSSNVFVVVSPEVPSSIAEPPGALPVYDFRQVVFTPQVAAAVRVFTVTRPIK
jgi:type II secretory pathway component PulJ